MYHLKGKRASGNELLSLVMVYTWMALMLSLAYFFVLGTPGKTSGIILTALAVAFTVILSIMTTRITSLLRKHRETARELEANIETLLSIYDVASGLSSKFFLDEVLESVVESAKQIVQTDKVVLHLVDIGSDFKLLNRRMVAVKGSRREHPESWWNTQIGDLAEEVLLTGKEKLISREPGCEPGSWLLCLPLKIKKKPVGILSAMNSYDRKFSGNDVAALTILATFAATAIENTRLIDKAQSLLVADERSRIAREMHDGIAQSLFSLVLNLKACQKQIEKDPLAVRDKIIEMQSVASQGLTEIRRYIYDLKPRNLEEMGLTGALDYHFKEICKLNGRTARLRVYGKRRSLPEKVESCIFRVAQEATNNIIKHSKVTSFTVSLKYADDGVELLVKDKGQGFDVEKALAKADDRKTLGLASMRERVAEQGGNLDIKSSPGKGTRIKVCLPYPKNSEAYCRFRQSKTGSG